MIQINLTLSVSLDATDLAVFDARLAAIARGIGLLAVPTESQDADQRGETRIAPPSESAFPRANPRPDEPNAPSAPKRRKINPRPPTTPARPVAHEIAPIRAATINGVTTTPAANPTPTPNGDTPPGSRPEGTRSPTAGSTVTASGSDNATEEDHPHPSNRLPFAEFDKLVRAEMKRLSMDGRLPGHALWNNERNPQLPTLAAVILRYGVTTLVDLAPKFGLQPPLSTQKGATHAA